MSTAGRVGAVILAGGLARRMGGQDKGLILLAGKPMVQYALEAIRDEVDCCVINANRNIKAYSKLGVPVVPDKLSGHLGPLAGLSAGMDALGTDYVFMCPCDSPFLQPALFSVLYNSCVDADADIVAAHDGVRLQPVFCLVHRRVKSSLDAFLVAGERKIDRWFDQHALIEVAAGQFAESFRNINTEEERLAAESALKL